MFEISKYYSYNFVQCTVIFIDQNNRGSLSYTTHMCLHDAIYDHCDNLPHSVWRHRGVLWKKSMRVIWSVLFIFIFLSSIGGNFEAVCQRNWIGGSKINSMKILNRVKKCDNKPRYVYPTGRLLVLKLTDCKSITPQLLYIFNSVN